MGNYADARNVLQKMGYDRFMPLQEEAFRNPAFYESDKDIFVSDDTSSGKTLIPLIHYVLERQKNPDYKMLFLVPYRALASQKQKEIEILLRRVFPDLYIALSTGECREDDMAIREGRVDAAVIIYEKAHHFSCKKNDFLKHYGTIVYDEFALTEDDARGAICDLLLLRGKNAGCRIFVLSTPYYSWGHYIHDAKFVPIQLRRREGLVPREEIPVFLDGTSRSGKIRQFHDIAGEALAIEGIRPAGTKDDLIEDICTKHLRMNHRILVFMNNCQEVRRMAGELARRLWENHRELLNATTDSAEKYFQQILDETGLLEEDLTDLMSPAECLAFARGIAYHNSWLGYTLRSLIEREALTDEGCLKVVFCTETMAYGINSNVDVVIVADMHKSLYERNYMPYKGEDGRIRVRGESATRNRFLSVNEYNNYIGRAGRYGRSAKGYAYALMTQAPGHGSIRAQWDKLLQLRANPPAAYSTLMQLDACCNRKEGCPYFPDACGQCSLKANEFAMPVLSLISAEGVTKEYIIRQMMRLPGLSQSREWVEKNVSAALECLIHKTRAEPAGYGWVRMERNPVTNIKRYCLTQSGQTMSGFVITLYEAGVMTQYLLGNRKCMPEMRAYTPEQLKTLLERDPFDLFFQLCYLPELQKIAFDFFAIPDVTNASGARRRQLYEDLCTKQLNSYRKKAISHELYNRLIYRGTNRYNYRQKLPALYRTLLTIMVYEWYKTASVDKLNDELNAGNEIITITPGRISRLSQQVSFYIQMTEALCQTFSNPVYAEIAQLLNRMELCLYFGIQESNARIIDAAQLKLLTRQEQLKVAQILDFCSKNEAIPSPESLTRRQKSDWRNILRQLHALPENFPVQQEIREHCPVLTTAETLFHSNRKEGLYEVG